MAEKKQIRDKRLTKNLAGLPWGFRAGIENTIRSCVYEIAQSFGFDQDNLLIQTMNSTISDKVALNEKNVELSLSCEADLVREGRSRMTFSGKIIKMNNHQQVISFTGCVKYFNPDTGLIEPFPKQQAS